ncbi:hypothetical protein KP509_01G041200 [Ceratopteris richardii]|nr:hypothetical protein KP509_01G041200 [Ceratopteris richardii]
MARSLRKVSMKKARLEVYIEGFTHSYETIVSHAGFFDTAHVIGKGRFASMFRSDIRGGLSLAVKVFNNPIPQSTFEREMINLHDSTGHINTLLPMRGYYANPVESAIFYDYMPRGSLHDVLRDSPFLLDWSKRIRIAIGVSQALHDLHSCSPTKILHQDLKSSNVLLNHDLQPLLADYGLMGLLFRSVVETPGYTPPEFACLSNSLRRYTEKTDVYAFGVVLLELLTGKDPVCHEENTQAVSDQDGICVPQNHENVHVSHLAKKGRASYDLEEGLGSRMHLVTLVLGLEKEGKGLELLSPIVVETCPSLDKQEEAYRLALLCIDEEPNRRPSMPELISTLERLSMSEMQ